MPGCSNFPAIKVCCDLLFMPVFKYLLSESVGFLSRLLRNEGAANTPSVGNFAFSTQAQIMHHHKCSGVKYMK